MGEWTSIIKSNLSFKKIKFLCNMGVATVTYPFYKVLFGKNRDVLLYSSHEAKGYVLDNARILYEYAEKNTNYENYYVVENAKQFQQKYPSYHFVESGSIKNYWLYMSAKKYLFSHGPGDIAPMIHRIKYNKNKAIFLGHGVDGFKRHFKNPGILEQREKASTFISVSQFEKSIKNNEWEIPNDDIFITGYPRFDSLNIRPTNELIKVNKILYAPTWRFDIADCEEMDFKETDYYRNVKNFVCNKKLNDFLSKNNIVMHVYLHFYFHKYFDFFKNLTTENIIFLRPDEMIQNYLIEDDILVTDYSSTSWDFYYMNKPVIFFMFDREHYLKTKGSYIDLYKESIGRIVTTPDQAVEQIIYTSENYNKEVKTFLSQKNKYFKYTDKDNCKRVMELINRE